MTARPFDPRWTTDSPALVAYLDRLCADLTAAETRARRRRREAQERFDGAIRAIVLDLFRAHISDPALEVGIAASWERLQRLSKSRYGASYLSARTFTDAMEALKGAGLIWMSTRHWDDPAKKNSRVARYMATHSLIDDLKARGCSAVDLHRTANTAGIRLKDDNKDLIEYEDNKFTIEARARLRTINTMLEEHWVDLALTDKQLAIELERIAGTRDDEATVPFDFAARTVYRVFNNCVWGQGGRFYGAWWISCPSKLRPYILIDGKRTVEADYSGLHAAMLYAQEGRPIPDDPYERCLRKAYSKQERALVKRTFNALLNADRVHKIQEIDGYNPEITGRSWQDFKLFVVSCFPEFQKYFGSGIGLELQRKDSDLAEAVMLRFAESGHACLPVHDSFIVHHALQGDLDQEMQRAFEKEFGKLVNVGVDQGIGEVIESMDSPIELDMNLDQFPDPPGYEMRLQRFWDNRSANTEKRSYVSF